MFISGVFPYTSDHLHYSCPYGHPDYCPNIGCTSTYFDQLC